MLTPEVPETDPMKIALIPPIDITPEAAVVAYPKPIHTQSLPLNRYPQGAHKSRCRGLIEILKYLNPITVLYCTDMDFYPAYNAFMSSNPNCKLRVKEGYVKSTNVPGTGKKGHIRSIAMTARNVEESKERSEHRAEQRQNHADTGGAVTAQRDRVPPGQAPDLELKMQGIESTYRHVVQMV